MSHAFVFPGQGSQAVGMGHALYETFKEARYVFEEVDDVLGYKLSKLIFEGPLETLTLTEHTQPALMTVSMAVMNVLAKQGHFDVRRLAAVAGHSLGEYTALAAAGSLSLRDAALLLKTRGQAMQKAVPVGKGAMIALLGLDVSDAEAVADQAADQQICVLANDNCPGQVVLSGNTDAIQRAEIIAKERGAKRCIPLPVSAPFHSPLMEPAALEMARALSAVEMLTPCTPVIPNVLARTESDPDTLKSLLVKQVTGRVRWRETMDYMADQGIITIIEVGAGKVLSGLAKKCNPGCVTLSIGTPDEIESFLKN